MECYDEGNDLIVDKENGYFSYYYCYDEDHAGYECACWDRTDGKKLMIVSYDNYSCYEDDGEYQAEEPKVKPWYYCAAQVDTYECEGTPHFKSRKADIGFVAYLYNEDTHMLEPMSQPPFNGWEAKALYRFLKLPQDGNKDIEVVSYKNIEDPDEQGASSLLKWNGMSFDYQE